MAYEIGTATDYKDLLERLKDFLSDPFRTIASGDTSISELVAIDDEVGSGEPSQAWTVDRWVDDRDSGVTDPTELIVHGPGLAGTDEIYVGIQCFEEVAPGDYYNWRLQGFTGFNALLDFNDQPGAMQSNRPRTLLWNDSILYWFVANGRRLTVVAKVSTIYSTCHLGFFLPYGTPSQSPYPLIVGGSATNDVDRWSEIDNGHRIFLDPGASKTKSTLQMLSGAVWYDFANFSTDIGPQTGNNVWPFVSGGLSSFNYRPWRELLQNLDSTVPLFPCILNSDASIMSKNIWGEFDGIFAVPGIGLSAEDTITVNGDDYVIFPNVYRVETHHFWALKKE